MLMNILLLSLNLITLGTAAIKEAKYTLCANCQFNGPTLTRVEDVRRLLCATACREYTDCAGFLAGTDNSCQLLGPGYFIDDPAGNNYYGNAPCEYELISLTHS
jgi:hypothetical protein